MDQPSFAWPRFIKRVKTRNKRMKRELRVKHVMDVGRVRVRFFPSATWPMDGWIRVMAYVGDGSWMDAGGMHGCTWSSVYLKPDPFSSLPPAGYKSPNSILFHVTPLYLLLPLPSPSWSFTIVNHHYRWCWCLSLSHVAVGNIFLYDSAASRKSLINLPRTLVGIHPR